MRGKHTSSKSLSGAKGITPAHAGKTYGKFTSCIISKDHPRACGENRDMLEIDGYELGSPPRMRGKQELIRTGGGDGGITPACAGKTRKAASCWTTRRDHPRVCGENRLALCFRQRLVGIIPACAGKTHDSKYRSGGNRDHPRVCGENWSRMEYQGDGRGSPPRVRGKPGSGGAQRADRGITPACAGKTR